MADISKELQEILEAVYGEEVRGSIHDAIEKMNSVGEKILSVGDSVTSESSPIIGFFDGSLYLNSDTNDLWKCDGTGWELVANLRGQQGLKGKDGNSFVDLQDNGDGTFSGVLSNGSITNPVNLLAGPIGPEGAKGDAGKNGISIVAFEDRQSGAIHNIWAIFSDGTSKKIGSISDGIVEGGDGDMKKSIYATEDTMNVGIVDNARRLNDGSREITIDYIVNKADSASSLAGYGISDAYTKSEIDNLLEYKPNKSNTLAGYGITDAYTKTQVDSKVADPIRNVIADTFSYSAEYEKGDYAIYSESLYRCKLNCQGQDIRDTTYWEQVKMADDVSMLIKKNTDCIKVDSTATTITPTSSQAGAIEQVILNKPTDKNYNWYLMNIWINVTSQIVQNGVNPSGTVKVIYLQPRSAAYNITGYFIGIKK